MKTTFNISDALMQQIRKLAKERGVSMTELIEAALAEKIASLKGRTKFQLKERIVNGKGLVEDLEEGNWSEIKRRIYED